MKDETLKLKESTPIPHRVKISGPGVIYTSSADVVNSPQGQKLIKYFLANKKYILTSGNIDN